MWVVLELIMLRSAVAIAGIIGVAAISGIFLSFILLPHFWHWIPRKEDPSSNLSSLFDKEMIMLRSAVAIAGIIGVAAISHRLLCHYLTSTESQTPKPQSQDEKKNKSGCTEQEAMMSDSDGIDVPLCCILNDVYTLYKLWEELVCYEGKCMLESHCYERRPLFGGRQAMTSTSNAFDASELRKPILEDVMEALADPQSPLISCIKFQAGESNSNAFDTSESRKPILGKVMEALTDPSTHLIGVHGFHNDIKDTLLEKVYRRVQRDQLFGMVVTATITERPDVKKIQEDIASQLGFTFNHMSKDKRAKELIHRIKNEPNILIVLRDLYNKLDLSKVGIPYGSDYMGCKIILTSTTEHVLSDDMYTQMNFMVS